MKTGSQPLKRLLSFIMALAMVLTMLPMTALAADADTTVYLVPNSNWTQANARFAIYCFGNGETWVDMSDPDGDGMYEAVVPAGYPGIIFCRMNPGTTANDWGNKWNRTADLTLPTDGTNCYTMAAGTWDQGSGTWSAYTPAPETVTVYFRNDWLWPEVYVHYWNDSEGTAWPGELMTKVGTDSGKDVYTIEIPAWATSLLFNGLENGNPSNRKQTPDISVVMDVVYSHVYDAGKFCMNNIVPNYLSRVNADGSVSNGSGCGNDTASEREMVSKYIVESVLYWHQEYHIDGFRFDLVDKLILSTGKSGIDADIIRMNNLTADTYTFVEYGNAEPVVIQ